MPGPDIKDDIERCWDMMNANMDVRPPRPRPLERRGALT